MKAIEGIRRLLLVEDNPGDARLLREMLVEQGCARIELTHVSCMRDAEAHLALAAADLILLDLGLPDAQGLEAVLRCHAAAPRVPLVVLTGLEDESLAAQALQEGAQDHLVKGEVDSRGLLRALGYAIDRKRMEDALFDEKERAQVTLNCIADAVACTDGAGDISFLNRAAEQLTGWSLRDATGKPVADVLRIVKGPHRELVANPAEVLAAPPGPSGKPSSAVLLRRDAIEIPIEESVSAIRDRQGKATGAVIVFRDVSAGRADALRMTHSAEHDFLTGLPNRMLLNDRLTQAIGLAPRHRKHVAVLFLDLDGFKQINDSLGHAIGDKLLQSVAARLVACVRAADTVSRQGGDEFVVLLSEVEHAEDVAIMAARMLQTVSETHSIDQHDLHVSTSIGASVYPDDGRDAETLLQNADTAMYQAKRHGRRGYKFFKPSMNVRAAERQSLEEHLRHALEREELELHYQPKVDLATGEITGAEALLRWTHPIKGRVPAAEFIPVAEESGLIVPIGVWVLREACRQARAWLEAGLPATTMAVNISALEFRDQGFVAGIFAALEEAGLAPGVLELELTESVLMGPAAATESILHKLSASGVRLAVDDFGSGSSSLSHLGRLPIDTLKIDPSFVRQITTSPNDAHLVNAVINMGRSLDLRVIAEGAETQAELDFLISHRCDEAQGYVFSQAVPAKQFARLLEKGLSKGVTRLAVQAH